MWADSPVTSARRNEHIRASPRRLSILGCSVLAMGMLGLIGAAGCSERIIDQASSLQGTRTEDLRDWVREDPHRDKLIVFVHGFNSSKDGAWGQFPALLKEDDDFRDFNIHRFGYPTELCRQVSDIRNQGKFLASFLTSIFKSTQPKYRQVVLVGHSMGGLVILHALQKRERDHKQLLIDQDLKVLTFGTPYLGVENTDVLQLFCKNRQATDMRVLNDTLGELAREWTQRFNQKPDTPQVPLYAFRGTEDRFVTETSACGYPQIPCEHVDGDHNSIVKPTTRKHLTYQKLKELATQPRVPRTTEDKIGIWVARLTGDDASHANQRSIARTLENFISKEDTQLQDAVEVRELSADITGNTLKEKEAEAKRLGQEQHASILVWGDVTKKAGVEELQPRVTLIKPLKLPTKTALLNSVSHASQNSQLSTPPGTVSMPPQSIQEPLQLARFVLAMTLMDQQAWVEAARHLEHYIGAGLSTAVRSADIYSYTGLAHHNVFALSGMPEPLTKARDAYERAVAGYQKEKDWDRYAGVQSNLGLTYGVLAQRGVAPEANLKLSVEALTEAARRYKEQENWADYAMVLFNLGFTHEMQAAEGPDREMSLEAASAAYEEALSFFAQARLNEWEAKAATRLKSVLQALIAQGVDVEKNQARLTGLTKAK